MVFFNKDADQPDAYKARPKALNHIVGCPCNECQRIKHAGEVHTSLNMLRSMGAF